MPRSQGGSPPHRPSPRPVLIAVPGPPGSGARARGAVVDADRLAADVMGHPPSIAAVVAAATISAWLGAAQIRTRHPEEVRRAVVMTGAIRGDRPPARTARGLA